MRFIVLSLVAFILFFSCNVGDVIYEYLILSSPKNVVTQIDSQNVIWVKWDFVQKAQSYNVESYQGELLGWEILETEILGNTVCYRISQMNGPKDSLNKIDSYVKFRVQARNGDDYSNYSVERSQRILARLEDELTEWGTSQQIVKLSNNTYCAKYFFKNTGNVTISSITFPPGGLVSSDSSSYYTNSLQPPGYTFSGMLVPGESVEYYTEGIVYPDTPRAILNGYYSFKTY